MTADDTKMLSRNKILFCYEVSFSICVDIKSATFFQCVTLKKGSRFDVNTDQETDLITEKNFNLFENDFFLRLSN